MTRHKIRSHEDRHTTGSLLDRRLTPNLDRLEERCDLEWPHCPWICHPGGIRLESLKHSWQKACGRVGLGKLVEVEDTIRKLGSARFRMTSGELSFGTLFELGLLKRLPWHSAADGFGGIRERVEDHPIHAATYAPGSGCQKTPLAARDRLITSIS